MTSTNSSVNHAARYDLKRCLKENALIPMAATALISYFLWVFVTVLNSETAKEFKWTIFSDYSGYSPSIFNMMYLLCGAITAVKAFYFLTSSKRCNVYLSMGIDRKTLLKNRMLSSIFWMALSSIIPLVVSLVANYLHFVITAETIETAIYISLCLFLNIILGFGVAGAVILSVGNVIETFGIYAILIMIPSTISLASEKLVNYMFNGLASVNENDTWGIEAYFKPFKTIVRYFIPFEFVEMIRTNEKFKVDFTSISALNWLTLFCWLVVGVLLVALMPKLMKKRKAEIAGAFGADRRLVAISSCIVAFLMFTIWCGVEFDNDMLRYLMMLIMPVVGYIIPVVFIYRNGKDIKDNLTGAAVTAVVSLLLTACSFTNCFGYFNKLPSADEVEYASIMPAAVEMLDKAPDRTLIPNNSLYGKITDIDDINKIISIHDRVTDELGEGDARVSVVYKLKNGKILARTYRNVSFDGAKASLEFINTKYYKSLVTDTLSLSKFDENKEREKLSGYFKKIEDRVEMSEYMMDVKIFEYKADFTNSIPAILNSTLSDKLSLDKVMTKTQILEFKKALASDLTNMTVEQTFYPQEKPLYFVHFYHYDYVDNGSYENKNFPIYSFMTNTLNILNKYSYHLNNLKNYTIEDIETTQIMRVQESIEVYDRWDKNIYSALDRTVCATYQSPKFYEETDAVYMPIYVSSDFDKATDITDKATIERYFNNYRSQYSFIGDDGVFVSFGFKDGGNFIAYIPEKFV